ncbi:unnamed protein product [Diplocarpon coronariae]
MKVGSHTYLLAKQRRRGFEGVASARSHHSPLLTVSEDCFADEGTGRRRRRRQADSSGISRTSIAVDTKGRFASSTERCMSQAGPSTRRSLACHDPGSTTRLEAGEKVKEKHPRAKRLGTVSLAPHRLDRDLPNAQAFLAIALDFEPPPSPRHPHTTTARHQDLAETLRDKDVLRISIT